MNDGLPQGWASIALGELTKPIRPRRNPQEYARLPFVGMEQVESHTRRLLGTLPSSEMKSAAFHFQPGDVLYGRLRPYLNKVLLADFEGLCSSEFIVLPPTNSFDPEYLAFYLNNDEFVAFANQLNQGDRPRVNFNQIGEHEIPLPPLSEQRRIVAKLEKLLGQLDSCQHRLTKIPTLLKRFRQSVLAAACSGRLTADWREEHAEVENALELLKRLDAKAEVLESNELPATWTQCRFESLASLITKGASPKWQGVDYAESGVLFVTSENVGWGKMLLTQKKFVEPKINKIQPRSVLKNGDLLTNLVGASIGRSAIYELDEIANTNQAVALIRLKPDLEGHYFLHVLNSPTLVDRINSDKVDVARANVSLADVRDFPIPLPPVPEQQEIVRRVEKLFALADQIEARFAEGRRRVDAITQSLLAKAFSGELVPTEYELAKAEGRSFESAEELLKRIKTNGQLRQSQLKVARKIQA